MTRSYDRPTRHEQIKCNVTQGTKIARVSYRLAHDVNILLSVTHSSMHSFGVGYSTANMQYRLCCSANHTRSSATAERQRVSYTHSSFSARSLIVHFTHWTPHLLYNYIIDWLKLYRHYQLTNRVTYVADMKLSNIIYFQGHLSLYHYKPVKCFRNNTY